MVPIWPRVWVTAALDSTAAAVVVTTWIVIVILVVMIAPVRAIAAATKRRLDILAGTSRMAVGTRSRARVTTKFSCQMMMTK